jgi:hypothetical protein
MAGALRAVLVLEQALTVLEAETAEFERIARQAVARAEAARLSATEAEALQRATRFNATASLLRNREATLILQRFASQVVAERDIVRDVHA